MRKFILLAALALAISCPAPARASILDIPPPLKGQKSLRLFTVPGVVTAGGLGTFFSCTNRSSSPATISVELYVEDGGAACNDASAVAVTAAPGATVMFATQNTADSSFFSSVPLSTPPAYLALGSASILSTSKSVVCNAFIADVYNSPPLSMATLKAIGKKQVGD
ncbi:MAG: hypothetical protein ABIR79_12435 [Candidatus Binatia bacterium]